MGLTLVPLDAQPLEVGEHSLLALPRRPRRVRVLHAQDHLAAHVLGEQPVEQRSARAADVQVAGGGGRKAHAHLQQQRAAPTDVTHHEILEQCRAPSSCPARKAASVQPASSWQQRATPRGQQPQSPAPWGSPRPRPPASWRHTDHPCRQFRSICTTKLHIILRKTLQANGPEAKPHSPGTHLWRGVACTQRAVDS